MDKNEINLIKLCQAGEMENFTYLYNNYVEKIYKYIFYKVKDKNNTEDLVSTTFFKALKGIKKFNYRDNYFSAWLYKIAKNTIADHFRFKKETSNLDDLFNLKADINIEEDYKEKEKKEIIRKALNKINKKQKEVIELRVWHELSYKEIGQILNKKEKNVKVIFSRALKNLKNEVPLALFITLLLTANLKYE